MEAFDKKPNITLEYVISAAIQLPGVKVNRDVFLREQFQGESEETIQTILDQGPVKAGRGRDALKAMAQKLVSERTVLSTGASFLAGLPGGFAVAATIPADVIQFYGVALRMAQELAYLYGEPDFWDGEKPEISRVTNQLILYCGVMLGADGAAQAVRVMSSPLAKQILSKLPQSALTKSFHLPVVKSVVKWFGVNVAKGLLARSASKMIPLVGGFVSGGITFATLLPMGQRLAETLDVAQYAYTKTIFDADWQDILHVGKSTGETAEEPEKTDASTAPPVSASAASSSSLDEIAKAKRMLDEGVLSEDEFAIIKAKLISKL